jgi:hypothetical protein
MLPVRAQPARAVGLVVQSLGDDRGVPAGLARCVVLTGKRSDVDRSAERDPRPVRTPARSACAEGKRRELLRLAATGRKDPELSGPVLAT